MIASSKKEYSESSVMEDGSGVLGIISLPNLSLLRRTLGEKNMVVSISSFSSASSLELWSGPQVVRAFVVRDMDVENDSTRVGVNKSMQARTAIWMGRAFIRPDEPFVWFLQLVSGFVTFRCVFNNGVR